MNTNPRRRSDRAPTEIDIYVGEFIRSQRSRSGMTLAALGKQIGISHQQLQKYETGTNRISAGMLYQFSQVLNVSVSQFFPSVDGEDPHKDGAEAIDTVRKINAILEEHHDRSISRFSEACEPATADQMCGARD